jgi:hypothetical protein
MNRLVPTSGVLPKFYYICVITNTGKMRFSKIFFTFLLFILCTPYAYCDTIDTYRIYYNNKLVKEHSIASDDTIPVIVKRSDITETDSITIIYSQDSPCESCKFYVVIIDKMKKLVKVVSAMGTETPLVFSLDEIRDWAENNSSEMFEVYYYKEKPAFPVHLFRLALE